MSAVNNHPAWHVRPLTETDIEAYLVPEPENAAFEVWLPVVRP